MGRRDERVVLERGSFKWNKPDEHKNHSVRLWNMAPIWPGRPRAKLTAKRLNEQITEAYNLTSPTGFMVLWMPAVELHRTPFDPIEMAYHWTAMSTVLSGMRPLHIGYVYCKGFDITADWGSKLILDNTGRGPSSSLTMKWLLEKLFTIGNTGVMSSGLVVDPYAHRSVQLAKWCRRFNIQYRGYIRSKKGFEAAQEALAQIELPGIQQALL